ncbi:leucine-rich repeat-containing protein 61-like isoform X2 [Xenia sp. Carnegie-2017]|uniref:leucine-rich repeat-containing protein 61-like isoform X2 n=1 Tax=Xenia sp. Carnegie-2017 TaxID=2897299 RepID=UPI001F03B057|nr:leucine-rich repeat-containing protein 61-like isoform X2 [Xenia sp. Carnegie-2017]
MNGICHLGEIDECQGLMYLNLSENRISNLTLLANLKDLTCLDLSENQISCLDGLEGLVSLEVLDVSGNLISSIESLHPLVNLKFLENLCLLDKKKCLTNPVCQTQPKYKICVCTLLPNISMLDGEKIVGQGSEVFKVFGNLAEKLDDLEHNKNNDNDLHMAEKLKNLDTKQNAILSVKTAQKVAWTSEQQFNDLLTECRSLNEEAEKAILNAKQALWGDP